jgi:hypothetical protein
MQNLLYNTKSCPLGIVNQGLKLKPFLSTMGMGSYYLPKFGWQPSPILQISPLFRIHEV